MAQSHDSDDEKLLDIIADATGHTVAQYIQRHYQKELGNRPEIEKIRGKNLVRQILASDRFYRCFDIFRMFLNIFLRLFKIL